MSESRVGAVVGVIAVVLAMIAAAVVAVVLMTSIGCWLSWSAFFRFGVGTDLDDFRRLIGQSDLPAAAQTGYFDRLDRIEQRLDDGRLGMSFFKWIEVDNAMMDVLEDGRVEPWEQRVLDSTFLDMERGDPPGR